MRLRARQFNAPPHLARKGRVNVLDQQLNDIAIAMVRLGSAHRNIPHLGPRGEHLQATAAADVGHIIERPLHGLQCHDAPAKFKAPRWCEASGAEYLAPNRVFVCARRSGRMIDGGFCSPLFRPLAKVAEPVVAAPR